MIGTAIHVQQVYICTTAEYGDPSEQSKCVGSKGNHVMVWGHFLNKLFKKEEERGRERTLLELQRDVARPNGTCNEQF